MTLEFHHQPGEIGESSVQDLEELGQFPDPSPEASYKDQSDKDKEKEKGENGYGYKSKCDFIKGPIPILKKGDFMKYVKGPVPVEKRRYLQFGPSCAHDEVLCPWCHTIDKEPPLTDVLDHAAWTWRRSKYADHKSIRFLPAAAADPTSTPNSPNWDTKEFQDLEQQEYDDQYESPLFYPIQENENDEDKDIDRYPPPAPSTPSPDLQPPLPHQELEDLGEVVDP